MGGRKKREASPEGKSEADAWLYYNTYGVWPSWYSGYYGYGLGLWGRKKREAEPVSEADAEAKPTTSPTEYGQPGTLDTTVSTDGNGVMPLANLFFHPPKY